MIKIYIIPYLLLITILFSSCSKTLLINQGEHGYSGELGDNYEITKLETVSTTGKSFFGFGSGKISKDGIVTNFFASDVNYKQSNFLRVLTFLVYSAIVPAIIYETKKDRYYSAYGPVREPSIEVHDIIGGLAFGGIANNLTWNKTAINKAIRKGSQQLIEDNPSVDLFVYPKYKITTTNGLFNSKASFTLNSKGASLKKQNPK